MKYKFKSGLEVDGTIEELRKIAELVREPLDLKDYYWSKSSGSFILIKTMNPQHIRNALCSIASDFYNDLQSKRHLTNTEFLNEFVKLVENENIVKLYNELRKR